MQASCIERVQPIMVRTAASQGDCQHFYSDLCIQLMLSIGRVRTVGCASGCVATHVSLSRFLVPIFVENTVMPLVYNDA